MIRVIAVAVPVSDVTPGPLVLVFCSLGLRAQANFSGQSLMPVIRPFRVYIFTFSTTTELISTKLGWKKSILMWMPCKKKKKNQNKRLSSSEKLCLKSTIAHISIVFLLISVSVKKPKAFKILSSVDKPFLNPAWHSIIKSISSSKWLNTCTRHLYKDLTNSFSKQPNKSVWLVYHSLALMCHPFLIHVYKLV